jgi:hypothetical protein
VKSGVCELRPAAWASVPNERIDANEETVKPNRSPEQDMPSVGAAIYKTFSDIFPASAGGPNTVNQGSGFKNYLKKKLDHERL